MERKLYRQNAMMPPLILRSGGRSRLGVLSTISLNDSHSRRRNLVVLACGERRKTKRIEKEPKEYFYEAEILGKRLVKSEPGLVRTTHRWMFAPGISKVRNDERKRIFERVREETIVFLNRRYGVCESLQGDKIGRC
jgi:hypothetical protein